MIKQSESYNTCRFYFGINTFLAVITTEHVINKIKSLSKKNKADTIMTLDFSKLLKNTYESYV